MCFKSIVPVVSETSVLRMVCFMYINVLLTMAHVRSKFGWVWASTLFSESELQWYQNYTAVSIIPRFDLAYSFARMWVELLRYSEETWRAWLTGVPDPVPSPRPSSWKALTEKIGWCPRVCWYPSLRSHIFFAGQGDPKRYEDLCKSCHCSDAAPKKVCPTTSNLQTIRYNQKRKCWTWWCARIYLTAHWL